MILNVRNICTCETRGIPFLMFNFIVHCRVLIFAGRNLCTYSNCLYPFIRVYVFRVSRERLHAKLIVAVAISVLGDASARTFQT